MASSFQSNSHRSLVPLLTVSIQFFLKYQFSFLQSGAFRKADYIVIEANGIRFLEIPE